MSSATLLVFLPYAAIAMVLTIWLARQLARHGLVFLRAVFRDRDRDRDRSALASV